MAGDKDDNIQENGLVNFIHGVNDTLFVKPAEAIRSVVLKNQPQLPWYHRSHRRVPTIDECYFDDAVCRFEANTQFQRDRKVEQKIVYILRRRFLDCLQYESSRFEEKESICRELEAAHDLAAKNLYIKYGDLPYYATAETALTKQKHRMIWERRHGEVGTGMKEQKVGAN